MKVFFKSNTLFAFVTVPFFLLLFVTHVIGSRLLINPEKVLIVPSQFKDITMPDEPNIVVYRSYPGDLLGLKRPIVRYIQVVHPLDKATNGGYSCREDNNKGMRYTHDDPRGFGIWSMRWAVDCIDAPLGWRYEVSWQALLFDVFPMRPVSMSYVHYVGFNEGG